MGGLELDAIRYLKSVPRYLLSRIVGRRFPGVYTSGLGCLSFGQVPESKLPGSRWTRVRPLVSGICGSDLATLTARGTPYFSPVTSTPFVFGHEVVGEVIETASGVGRVVVGDRVVLEPPLPCRVREIDPPCGPCREGREPQCEFVDRGIISAGIQTGFCRDTGGGWSGNFVAHEEQLHLVEPAGDLLTQVLVEPFSCGLKAVLSAPPKDTDTVVVLGCGTMGLLTLAALRGIGSSCRILAAARHGHQQEAARRLGADEIIGGRDNALEHLADLLGARILRPELGKPVLAGGADRCFDCVGSGDTLDDSCRLTRAGGTVVVLGMPGAPSGVDWTAMWHKELRVQGSYTSDHSTFKQAVQMITDGSVRLEGIAGASFALSQYRQAVRTALKTGHSGVIKTVFEIAAPK